MHLISLILGVSAFLMISANETKALVRYIAHTFVTHLMVMKYTLYRGEEHAFKTE